MLDSRLISYLERQQIPFCLIGGLALAAWGVARYTADADLLTLDSRILDTALWSDWGTISPRITKGDAADILALLGNAEALRRPALKEEVASTVPQLTHDARIFWTKISAL